MRWIVSILGCTLFAPALLPVASARAPAPSTPLPSPQARAAAPTNAVSASPQSSTRVGQLVRLQNAAANPIASLVSIPFQYNLNFDYGAGRQTQQLLNVQPTIPVALSGGRTLVTRTIVPLYAQPALGPTAGPQVALGDINPAFYYVPKQGALMLGYGASFVLPSATSSSAGQGKWSGGPALIGVLTHNRSVFGLLLNNVWSFAGNTQRAPVNQAQIQTFVHVSMGNGFGVGALTQTAVDWNAGTHKWTVPFGPTAAQLIKLGDGMGGQIVGGVFWNVVHPAGTGNWTARLQFTILQPADADHNAGAFDAAHGLSWRPSEKCTELDRVRVIGVPLGYYGVRVSNGRGPRVAHPRQRNCESGRLRERGNCSHAPR